MAEDFSFDIKKAKNYCIFCQSISFHKLPHEEDPGFPHHPSFASLKSSARSCLLCYLLLQGIKSTTPSLQDEGGWRLFTSYGKESIPAQIIMGAGMDIERIF